MSHYHKNLEIILLQFGSKLGPYVIILKLRKKEGIFYTPKYITKYIVENTVGKLCEEKRNELEIIVQEYAKGRKNRNNQDSQEE